MKKIFKCVIYFLIGLMVIISFYLIGAFCLSRITVNEEIKTTKNVTIYIKTNGVHTDIIVPVKNSQIDWSKEIKFSHTQLNDTMMRYLALGWGDKGFYLETPKWADLKFSTAFKAAFALGTTAIHATFYDTLIENQQCKKIMLSKDQYARLIKYISNSFKNDDHKHIINIITKANYSNKDAFYEANDSYSMLHTCNTWANTGLKKCGQRACLWTPFDTGIFLKYQ